MLDTAQSTTWMQGVSVCPVRIKVKRTILLQSVGGVLISLSMAMSPYVD